ncbi:hypothetical protein L227DRAFT_570181 [Lentinus tigrinus ALCF2SS1-6]|uniref:DUF6533 domain-containing protein n=1 Tax=Lentinus tigrinus ALCF2SS1-6 TaxID=1328759 RepID=A0A5C2ST81_9APHY|nr:hypothetical protein L227DRAFT_570181 [Lentinus tigrinus ALCF2SS1-6]
MIAFSMLYYDYLLTLLLEVDLFWSKARFSTVSLLFLINRYLGLFGVVPVILEYFEDLPPSVSHLAASRCRQLQTYHEYYAIISQSFAAALLIIRTYALYDRSKRVLISLLALGVTCIVVVLVCVNVKVLRVTANLPLSDPIVGCDLYLTAEQGDGLCWMSMLCMDTTIFALTLIKMRELGHVIGYGMLRLFFRDVRTSTTCRDILSTTLVSRIFINLRDPESLRGRRRMGRRTLTVGETPDSNFLDNSHVQSVAVTVTSCLELEQLASGGPMEHSAA